jgi:hypothetical protein
MIARGGVTERGLRFVVAVDGLRLCSAYQERSSNGGRVILDENEKIRRSGSMRLSPMWVKVPEIDLGAAVSDLDELRHDSFRVSACISSIPAVVSQLLIDGWGESIRDVVSWFGNIASNDWFPDGASMRAVGSYSLAGFSGDVERSGDVFMLNGIAGIGADEMSGADLMISIGKSVDTHSNRVHSLSRGSDGWSVATRH